MSRIQTEQLLTCDTYKQSSCSLVTDVNRAPAYLWYVDRAPADL